MNICLKVKPFQETLHVGYCGPASLKIILGYYGLEVTEEELAQETDAQEILGTNAESICRTAEKFGFNTKVQNECSFQDIVSWLEKDIPVIVDWFTIGRDDYPEDVRVADGHYSVVSGLNDSHIYLQDPEIGRERKIKRDAFEKVWFDFTGEFIDPEELIVRQLIAIYR
jgi:ABC-type bacteriocin/lantibiotic exporter with double-glycine peptidase domain